MNDSVWWSVGRYFYLLVVLACSGGSFIFSFVLVMAASIALNAALSIVLSFLSFTHFILRQLLILTFFAGLTSLLRSPYASPLTIHSGAHHEHLDSGATGSIWLSFKTLFTSWLVHPSIHLRQLYMVSACPEDPTSACVRRIIRNRHPPPLALRAHAAVVRRITPHTGESRPPQEWSSPRESSSLAQLLCSSGS
jgi:hypothetical protein